MEDGWRDVLQRFDLLVPLGPVLGNFADSDSF